jgi:hypothetical protein
MGLGGCTFPPFFVSNRFVAYVVVPVFERSSRIMDDTGRVRFLHVQLIYTNLMSTLAHGNFSKA